MSETNKTVRAGLFKPELWSKQLLNYVNNNGVMIDCVNRKYEGEIKNQGDTVNIQRVGTITITDYNVGTPLTYQSLAGTTQQLKIDQEKAWAFLVPDIDKVQANVEFMKEYIAQAGKEIVLVKDSMLLSRRADVPTANQLGTVAITPVNVYNRLVSLRTRLSRANALTGNKGGDGKAPWLVVSPEVLGVILESTHATHATKLGDDVIRKGAIARIAGFDVMESTNVQAISGGHPVLAGTTEAITYADQIIKTEKLRDKDNFSDYVRGLYVYGSRTINPHCLASATFTLPA